MSVDEADAVPVTTQKGSNYFSGIGLLNGSARLVKTQPIP
jgi:hypothetical protein